MIISYVWAYWIDKFSVRIWLNWLCNLTRSCWLASVFASVLDYKNKSEIRPSFYNTAIFIVNGGEKLAFVYLYKCLNMIITVNLLDSICCVAICCVENDPWFNIFPIFPVIFFIIIETVLIVLDKKQYTSGDYPVRYVLLKWTLPISVVKVWTCFSMLFLQNLVFIFATFMYIFTL